MNANSFLREINQRGFTLIELMVALTIGLFLVGAVGTLYVNTRGSFDYANEVARIQEAGRFGLEAISRDTRMAGYNGCGATLPNFTISNILNVPRLANGLPSNPSLDFSTPIRGYEGGVDIFPGALTAAGAISGSTDAIILLGVDSSSEMVVQLHTPASARIDTSTHSIQAGEILLITDCSKASIFQVSGPTNTSNTATYVEHNTGGSSSPGNCLMPLSSTCMPLTSGNAYFKPGSQLMRVFSNAYFIAPASQGNGLRSLYTMALEGRTDGTPVARELLVGVDDMQIIYGVDTDGDGATDNYVTANGVGAANWAQVTAVKISLLVRSTSNNVTTTSQPYNYAGTPGSINESTTTPTDRVMRRVFSETVVARNRTL